ncbi:response regulator [Pseudoalteromonas rubra]|uniref:response regulator n=1 Tax=Pseudoalteromonas rubra TaxID=43658 RepID=UPI000F7ADF21|nr:response regulator [Pseudoalteromonas rubra]
MQHAQLVKLLLVEDDEDDYILALDYLQQIPNYQFEVTWLSELDEVLQALESDQFDLCLLDHQLGGHTGLTILEAAKALPINTSFMMLTGQADEVLDADAQALGAEDFLLKSEISSPRFIRAIRYALSRRELESERLERLRAQATSRAKDRFLAHLSHELRTPLTSIMGYTDLLLTRSELDNIKPELSIIHNNSQHLLNLLNDVLDLSKINANSLQVEPSEICLASLLADLHSLFSMAADKKGLQFAIHTDAPLPAYIESDEKRLKQVLINLVYNAIKFTPSGQVSIEVRPAAEGKLCFAIEDTGIGIPQDKLTHIFKPFEQVQDSTTRSEEGAGLGLAISSALIRLLGGSLQVESSVGSGSTFSFTIEPGQCSGQLGQLDLLATTVNRPSTKITNLSGKVLIVEDLPEIRQLLGQLITATGADVSYAENGKVACDLLTQAGADFDLVFMDLHMPVLNGKDAIVKLRAQGISTPIISLTAAAQKGNLDTLKALGFNDTLTKPINVTQLESCLQDYLSAQPAQDTLTTQPGDSNVEKRRILLVEDDPDARNLMKLLLESLECEVVAAGSCAEGLSQLDKHADFDVVMLDLNLPDGSGLALVAAIHKRQSPAKLVVVSGSEPDPDALLSYPVSQVLLKPVSLPDLAAIVQST